MSLPMINYVYLPSREFAGDMEGTINGIDALWSSDTVYCMDTVTPDNYAIVECDHICIMVTCDLAVTALLAMAHNGLGMCRVIDSSGGLELGLT
jgi:hypothetical protein